MPFGFLGHLEGGQEGERCSLETLRITVEGAEMAVLRHIVATGWLFRGSGSKVLPPARQKKKKIKNRPIRVSQQKRKKEESSEGFENPCGKKGLPMQKDHPGRNLNGEKKPRLRQGRRKGRVGATVGFTRKKG